MSETEGGPEILVVDDEAGIRKSLSMILKKEGYSVSEAANGQDAMNILSEGAQFDVVLLDIKMPKMDGMKLLGWIANHNIVTSVIMLSGLDETDMAASTVRIGAFDYLTKPVRKAALLEAVKKAVANTSDLREPVFA